VWNEALNEALPLNGPIQGVPPDHLKPILSGGEEAVSYLLDKIEGTLPQRLATRLSQSLPIMERFSYVPDFKTKNSVPMILAQMGDQALPQISRMKRIILTGPLNHLNLVHAVANIGRDDPETIGFLTTLALNQKTPATVRGNCVYYLGMQSPSHKIVEALKRFCADPDFQVQQYAYRALGKQGALAQTATPLLISALSSSDYEVRCSAASSLGRIETNTAVLRQVLSPLILDTNKEVSSAVQRVLSSLAK
jgi:hypothetical protein